MCEPGTMANLMPSPWRRDMSCKAIQMHVKPGNRETMSPSTNSTLENLMTNDNLTNYRAQAAVHNAPEGYSQEHFYFQQLRRVWQSRKCSRDAPECKARLLETNLHTVHWPLQGIHRSQSIHCSSHVPAYLDSTNNRLSSTALPSSKSKMGRKTPHTNCFC